MSEWVWDLLREELDTPERGPGQDRPALVCFCGAETRDLMCMNPICPEYRKPVIGEEVVPSGSDHAQ